MNKTIDRQIKVLLPRERGNVTRYSGNVSYTLSSRSFVMKKTSLWVALRHLTVNKMGSYKLSDLSYAPVNE